jgi:hypothetical protein
MSRFCINAIKYKLFAGAGLQPAPPGAGVTFFFAGAGLQPAFFLLEQVCNLLHNVFFAGAGLQAAFLLEQVCNLLQQKPAPAKEKRYPRGAGVTFITSY